MRVLILYTELAGYVLSNINRFLQKNEGSEALIIHYPVNPEAPFDFSSYKNMSFIDVSQVDQELIEKRIFDLQPDIVLCSGWANKFYLSIVRKLPASVKKVICLDNQWIGTLKQFLLVLISPFWLLKMFTYAWVPGDPQKKYALKLGFKKDNIFKGLYPADFDLYSRVGKAKLKNKHQYPRKMISIARYIAQKDLPTLWKAFIHANTLSGEKWELNCFGYGELFDSKIENSHIHHLGFKQPHQMEAYILAAGIYVLPSTYEPWGVAVHEMALSALPMVLSDKVGAGSMFLSAKNGFVFPAGNQEALQAILLKIMNMDDEDLWHMAEESFHSGLGLSSDDWADTLNTILER